MVVSTPTHYYITKWALSEGVIVVPANLVTNEGDRIAWPSNEPSYRQRSIWGQEGWHDCREGAEIQIARMKVKRRKSLEKAIAKLDKPIPFKDFV